MTKDTLWANLRGMNLVPTDLKPSDLARIGMSRSHASELLSGRKLPSLEKAIELEDKLAIPARWWIDRKRARAA